MSSPPLATRCIAEFVGTFWLVFAGIGTAVTAAAFPALGVGFIGVSFAVGLSVLTMAYAVGHISGCHLNPAVSIGLCAGRRFPAKDLLPYIVSQVLGGLLGAAGLYIIASGKSDPLSSIANLGQHALLGASNGYGDHSPGNYSLLACFVAEAILTFMFLMIIMGSTDRRAPQGFAPIAIGLGLTLIHLVGIPITNLSVNPARSTATALFGGDWAIPQLWLFWLAPILGGLLGGITYHLISGREYESPQGPLEKLAQQSEAAATRAERQIP